MPRRASSDDLRALRATVERALATSSDPDELLPLLAKLARSAPPHGDDWLLAHRHLASLGVSRDPWRAALFARRVLEVRPSDDEAWAVLGLAHTLLGNYRAAAAAHRRAIALAPDVPWYAHNLGHLLDVAFDTPEDALSLLASAHQREPRHAEIAASYAHALGRVGRLREARALMRAVVAGHPTPEQLELARWLEGGAPGRPRRRKPRRAAASRAKR